jgi:hypothetical protein
VLRERTKRPVCLELATSWMISAKLIELNDPFKLMVFTSLIQF